jgi:hypothetical protein
MISPVSIGTDFNLERLSGSAIRGTHQSVVDVVANLRVDRLHLSALAAPTSGTELDCVFARVAGLTQDIQAPYALDHREE